MPRSCEATHEDSKVKAQEGGEIHHIATNHGPMFQGGLLTAHPGGVHGDGWLSEVNPPSGRVPGQCLLAALILKQRRRRNIEEIGKRGSLPRVSSSGGKYRRKGTARGPPGAQAPPGRDPTPGRATRVPRALVGPLRLPLYYSGSF